MKNPNFLVQMLPILAIILCEEEKSLALKADVLWNNNNVPRDQVVARGMKVRFLQLTGDEQLFLKEILSTT